jgi:DNA-binding response OmpR family regulator
MLTFQPCPLWRRRYPRGVLSEHERAIYLVLLWHLGRPVALSTLLDVIYGNDPSGGPACAEDVIRVQVCHLRRKLVLRIETRRGFYRLLPD